MKKNKFVFDCSWTALFNPGKNNKRIENIEYDNFEYSSDFSLNNALFFAEISHWAYSKQNSDNGIIKQIKYFGHKSIQGSILKATINGKEFGILVFRGSDELTDWVYNLDIFMTNWYSGGKVYRGFKTAFDNIWPEIEKIMTDLNLPFFYTGHSLGAGLSILASSKKSPIAAYIYGSPKIGDSEFIRSLQDKAIYSIVNENDIVTKLPLSIVSQKYRHAGEKHYLKTTKIEKLWSEKKFWQPLWTLVFHAPINYVIRIKNELTNSSK